MVSATRRAAAFQEPPARETLGSPVPKRRGANHIHVDLR